VPGRGDFDFADLFRALNERGFSVILMNAFGTLEDMLAARATLAAMG